MNTPAQIRKRDTATHCTFCLHKLYDKGKHQRTIDRFFPITMGKGLDRGWNKVIVCWTCNQIKGNKQPLQFVEHLKAKLNKRGHTPQYIQDTKDIINNVSRIYDELLGWYIMRDLI